MARTWDVIYNIMLIVASTYGLTRPSLRSKKFATIALALYCINGGLGLSRELTNNQNIADVDNLVYGIANTIGVDLFVTDVCITLGIKPVLSYLILLPPATDLFMKYVANTSWNRLTDITHVLSVAVLFIFAIRDGRPILIISGMAFLFAVLNGRNTSYDYDDVTAYNAIAVFFTTWFLEGKDFKDMGF